MLSDFLKKNIKSQAEFVNANGWGYAQVEPNHIASQASKEVYAQLPAAAKIDVLEQGQFAKYDYLNGEVNFTGKGEWMLVYNEIKLYRDHQDDCEFALIKDNFQARVYSPFGGDRNGNPDTVWEKQARYLNGNGKGGFGHTIEDGKISFEVNGEEVSYPVDDVTAAPDMYEIHYNEDPFHIESLYKEQMMKEGTTMVPRLLKTHIGDHYITNCIGEKSVNPGDILSPRAADGILSKTGDGTMEWQVVKVCTMPDHQPGVKIIRVK